MASVEGVFPPSEGEEVSSGSGESTIRCFKRRVQGYGHRSPNGAGEGFKWSLTRETPSKKALRAVISVKGAASEREKMGEIRRRVILAKKPRKTREALGLSSQTASVGAAAMAYAVENGLRILWLTRTGSQVSHISRELRALPLYGRRMVCLHETVSRIDLRRFSHACRAVRLSGRCPYWPGHPRALRPVSYTHLTLPTTERV